MSRLEYLASPISITFGFCVALRLAFRVLPLCNDDGGDGNAGYGVPEVSDEVYRYRFLGWSEIVFFGLNISKCYSHPEDFSRLWDILLDRFYGVLWFLLM